MSALKWIIGAFVVSTLLALGCFVSAKFMLLGDSPDREGLWFLMSLLAFIGLACSTVLFLIVGPRVLSERQQSARPKQKVQPSN